MKQKVSGQGMRTIDVTDLIDDSKFTIERLMMEEEGCRGYIVGEAIR